MEDDAACVDHPAEAGSKFSLEPGGDRRLAVPVGGAVPLVGDLLPDRVDDALSAVFLDQGGISRLVDERAYCGQGRSPLSPGTW
jgi:hypothetical protein